MLAGVHKFFRHYSFPFQPFLHGTVLRHSTSKRTLSYSNADRSIRQAISGGRVNEGYQIFLQSHSPNLKHSTISKIEPHGSKKGRFLAHVLIHSLFRSQKPLLAASFMEMCMQRGMKFHSVTFEKVFQGVCKPFKPADRKKRLLFPKRITTSPSSPSLKAAVAVLNAAKKSGNKRSSWMYDRLIHALLLQGEVLTAAFLFAALVREWNYRRKHPQAAKKDLRDVHTENHLREDYKSPPSTAISPRPSHRTMHEIVTSIESTRVLPITKQSGPKIAVQALSYLVSLVHEVEFIPSQASLLRAMYMTPQQNFPDNTVYDHWHAALLKLCVRPVASTGLDIASYHILLQYALRHKKSVELAGKVIKALCTYHVPTSVTYNILLREFTLSRDNNLAEAIKRRLVKDNALPVTLASKKNVQVHADEDHEILQELRRFPTPNPDEYTILALMSNLIARGQSEMACNIVIQLFPMLRQSERDVENPPAGLATRKRSKRLSPHFWATAVNAASKAGSLTLATRIWNLVAEEGRSESKQGDHNNGSYSVEAYTSHLQLFVKELRKLDDQSRSLMLESSISREASSASDILRRYNFVLNLAQRVLIALKDRTTSRDAVEFRADTRLLDTLLALVEIIMRLEQSFKEASPLASQRSPLIHQSGGIVRASRILGIIQATLSHYKVQIPSHLRELGFSKDSAAKPDRPKRRLRHRPTIPSHSGQTASIRKSKYGFRILYSRGLPKDTNLDTIASSG